MGTGRWYSSCEVHYNKQNITAMFGNISILFAHLGFAAAALLRVCAAVSAEEDKADYSGDQVYRVFTHNASALVHDMIRPVVGSQYDVWMQNDKFVDVRLGRDAFAEIARENSLEYEVYVSDIEAAIRDTMPGNSQYDVNSDSMQHAFGSYGGDLFFDEYRDLHTIDLWLQLLEQTYPSLVKLEQITTTPEGHPLNVVHVSAQNTEANPDKKTIVISGGLHAREWISVSTTLFMLQRLLQEYGQDKSTTHYLDSLDFLFIPVFNPDGYEYSWHGDRLWRKNRQATGVEQCPGIDLDRSFNYEWDESEAHEYPCSESYNGGAPFAAAETKAWHEYLGGIKGDYRIFGYLDLHSYSEEILYPYGYSCEAVPRDFENLLELAFGLAKAVRLTTRKNYDVVAACKDAGSDLTPGMGGGSALDYMYHNRARWALQLKLRDTGSHGFLLPPKFIRPVGHEIYAALRYFCGFILNPEM